MDGHLIRREIVAQSVGKPGWLGKENESIDGCLPIRYQLIIGFDLGPNPAMGPGHDPAGALSWLQDPHLQPNSCGFSWGRTGGHLLANTGKYSETAPLNSNPTVSLV